MSSSIAATMSPTPYLELEVRISVLLVESGWAVRFMIAFSAAFTAVHRDNKCNKLAFRLHAV
jgi:hypothetical protein